jgi:hypothetical protein
MDLEGLNDCFRNYNITADTRSVHLGLKLVFSFKLSIGLLITFYVLYMVINIFLYTKRKDYLTFSLQVSFFFTLFCKQMKSLMIKQIVKVIRDGTIFFMQDINTSSAKYIIPLFSAYLSDYFLFSCFLILQIAW